MSTAEIIQAIRGSKVELYTTDKDVDSALNQAIEIAKAHNMPTGTMTACIIIYHNTLLEALAKVIEEENNEKP
ncbi:hypothetical protein vBAspPH44_5 [Alteromonas phage vB_AspP-H4/4]|uniref:Uncharacterized protein n=1 Tax=Alteromonas phage vB_AspP-H4/4 TaxID=2928692 RepID=A0A220YL38_9CAUD|nr:hypothetical protein HOR85_gp05 [Alteromonas phage vB_AspP-H4/4]ASL24388.1 hypothetical protein vBAspPH44_5 [Alteromonas phage vB_AspP-H4/4]